MTLLYPWVLLGFPLYLLCERWCKSPVKKIYFPNVAMLQAAAGSRIDRQRILRTIIIFLILLALAAPVQKQQTTQNQGSGHDIALLLDASDSMQEDKRFDMAKHIIADFIQSRKGDRLALGLFADYAYLSVPLTSHTEALSTVLKYLQIGVAGKKHTALYESLYLGSTIFAHATAKEKIIILLTDGLNTVKSVPLKIALSQVKKAQVKVYTIGIGDDYRKAVLERIAHETGGRFYEASNPKALHSIYAEINRLEKSTFATETITYHRPLFRYPLLLAILLLFLSLYLAYRQSTLVPTHYVVLLLAGIALYGPYSIKDTHHATQNPSQSIITAIDLSYSMSCQDSFPSRLEIAYNRASALIDLLPSAKIGLIGFATQSYLITPPTQDHANLKLLLKRIDTDTIHREGSHILSALQSAHKLLSKQQDGAVILFTDGGEIQDFATEIAYAKSVHLQVYVYALGTHKGGVIKEKGSLRKDPTGNIIITRRNPAIAQLATETGGKYLLHTASGIAMQALVSAIESRQTLQKEQAKTQLQKRELYSLPLLLALLLYLSIHLSFRRER